MTISIPNAAHGAHPRIVPRLVSAIVVAVFAGCAVPPHGSRSPATAGAPTVPHDAGNTTSAPAAPTANTQTVTPAATPAAATVAAPVQTAPSIAPGPAAPSPAPVTPRAAVPSQTANLVTPALQATTFATLPGWSDDDVTQAWPAFLQGCTTLRNRAEWVTVCDAAVRVDAKSRWSIRKFFTDRFQPYRVRPIEGPAQGLVTGYYEPLLRGSRTRHDGFGVPLYAPPDDLLAIDLASFVPDASNDRVRGRVAVGADGKRTVVPYYTRGEIMRGSAAASLSGRELVWVEDPVEAFFLQVQGSGRVQLDNGNTIRLGYADTNGQPYRSIGRWLIERGELKPEDASLQSIRAWARNHPQRVDELLMQNPGYVFFRELPNESVDGPLGSLGIALTPERSIAVDPRHVPIGAPVWLATTQPMSNQPLRRLVLAQDTGSAIRGAVRADLFWGSGARAGELAGRMKQPAEMWVLLPRK